MTWFNFKNTPSVPVAPVIQAVPYPVKMAQSREALHWDVKKHSNDISARAYSEIRELEKTLQEINVFLETHTANAADEHILDSIMKDYLPSAIELFLKLPENKREVGGEGERLLLKQCRTMADDLRKRKEELHDRATKDLRTQAAFIEDRFSEGNAT